MWQLCCIDAVDKKSTVTEPDAALVQQEEDFLEVHLSLSAMTTGNIALLDIGGLALNPDP